MGIFRRVYVRLELIEMKSAASIARHGGLNRAAISFPGFPLVTRGYTLLVPIGTHGSRQGSSHNGVWRDTGPPNGLRRTGF